MPWGLPTAVHTSRRSACGGWLAKEALEPWILARLRAGHVEGVAAAQVILAPVRVAFPLSGSPDVSDGTGSLLRTVMPEVLRRSGALDAAHREGTYSCACGKLDYSGRFR